LGPDLMSGPVFYEVHAGLPRAIVQSFSVDFYADDGLNCGSLAIFPAIRRALHSLALGKYPTYPPPIQSEQFYTDSE
jgi:hypothetical protein